MKKKTFAALGISACLSFGAFTALSGCGDSEKTVSVGGVVDIDYKFTDTFLDLINATNIDIPFFSESSAVVAYAGDSYADVKQEKKEEKKEEQKEQNKGGSKGSISSSDDAVGHTSSGRNNSNVVVAQYVFVNNDEFVPVSQEKDSDTVSSTVSSTVQKGGIGNSGGNTAKPVSSKTEISDKHDDNKTATDIDDAGKSGDINSDASDEKDRQGDPIVPDKQEVADDPESSEDVGPVIDPTLSEDDDTVNAPDASEDEEPVVDPAPSEDDESVADPAPSEDDDTVNDPEPPEDEEPIDDSEIEKDRDNIEPEIREPYGMDPEDYDPYEYSPVTNRSSFYREIYNNTKIFSYSDDDGNCVSDVYIYGLIDVYIDGELYSSEPEQGKTVGDIEIWNYVTGDFEQFKPGELDDYDEYVLSKFHFDVHKERYMIPPHRGSITYTYTTQIVECFDGYGNHICTITKHGPLMIEDSTSSDSGEMVSFITDEKTGTIELHNLLTDEITVFDSGEINDYFDNVYEMFDIDFFTITEVRGGISSLPGEEEEDDPGDDEAPDDKSDNDPGDDEGGYEAPDDESDNDPDDDDDYTPANYVEKQDDSDEDDGRKLKFHLCEVCGDPDCVYSYYYY